MDVTLNENFQGDIGEVIDISDDEPENSNPEDEAEDCEVINISDSDDGDEEEMDDSDTEDEERDKPARDDEEEMDDSDTEDEERDKPARDDATLVFSKHAGAVFSVDLQPGGENLAVSGAQDDTAYVWDTSSGEVLLNCTDHKDSVISCGFNHSGTYVATGDLSGFIQVWKLSTKSQIWSSDVGDISWIKWHPGASVLLAAAKTGEVYVWKIPRGDTKVLQGHNIRSECGGILPDGKRLAVGYDDGILNLFDIRSSKSLFHVPPYGGLTAGIISMDCYADNNLLLYGTEGTLAHVVMTRTGKVASTFNCAGQSFTRDGVEAVGFCKDPTICWAATGTLSGRLAIWDISKEARRQEHEQNAGITKLLWLRSDLLITGGMDGVVRLYDGRSGNVEKELLGHTKSIFDLAATRNNYHRILSTSDDKTVRVFNIAPSGEKKAM